MPWIRIAFYLRSLAPTATLRCPSALCFLRGTGIEAKRRFRGLRLYFTTTTCSSVPRIQKRCVGLPGHGTSDGLSPVPALTYRCPGHCPVGSLSRRTVATLGFTG